MGTLICKNCHQEVLSTDFMVDDMHTHCAETVRQYKLQEERRELREENEKLRNVFIEVAIPLEVLGSQIEDKPYTELTTYLQDQIIKARDQIREVVKEMTPSMRTDPQDRPSVSGGRHESPTKTPD